MMLFANTVTVASCERSFSNKQERHKLVEKHNVTGMAN